MASRPKPYMCRDRQERKVVQVRFGLTREEHVAALMCHADLHMGADDSMTVEQIMTAIRYQLRIVGMEITAYAASASVYREWAEVQVERIWPEERKDHA